MGLHAFFVDPVEEELMCQICYRPLEKPVTHCTQGHTFCRPCIRQWLDRPQHHKNRGGGSGPQQQQGGSSNPSSSTASSNKASAAAPHCPGCMLPMGPETRNILAENLIAKLRVRCKNCSEQGDGRECEWVGRLEELQYHCNTKCEYEQVECAHSGCTFSDWRLSVRSHQASCPHRRVQCSVCSSWKGKALDEARHLGTDCPLVVLTCINQGCGERFERRESSCHYERECQFQPVECVFAAHGCTVRPLRKDQGHHQAEAAVEHASLTSQKISVLEDSMTTVIEKFEDLRRRVDKSERTTRETIISLVANPSPGLFIVLYSRIMYNQRAWNGGVGLLHHRGGGDERLTQAINLFLEGVMTNLLDAPPLMSMPPPSSSLPRLQHHHHQQHPFITGGGQRQQQQERFLLLQQEEQGGSGTSGGGGGMEELDGDDGVRTLGGSSAAAVMDEAISRLTGVNISTRSSASSSNNNNDSHHSSSYNYQGSSSSRWPSSSNEPAGHHHPGGVAGWPTPTPPAAAVRVEEVEVE